MNSNIFSYQQEIGGIVADPLFVNPIFGDFRLSVNSSAKATAQIFDIPYLNWSNQFVAKNTTQKVDIGALQDDEPIRGPAYRVFYWLSG